APSPSRSTSGSSASASGRSMSPGVAPRNVTNDFEPSVATSRSGSAAATARKRSRSSTSTLARTPVASNTASSMSDAAVAGNAAPASKITFPLRSRVFTSESPRPRNTSASSAIATDFAVPTLIPRRSATCFMARGYPSRSWARTERCSQLYLARGVSGNDAGCGRCWAGGDPRIHSKGHDHDRRRTHYARCSYPATGRVGPHPAPPAHELFRAREPAELARLDAVHPVAQWTGGVGLHVPQRPRHLATVRHAAGCLSRPHHVGAHRHRHRERSSRTTGVGQAAVEVARQLALVCARDPR